VAFAIRFAAGVAQQLHHLKARDRATVLDAIEHQLTHEPLVEARHRKPLRPNPVAPWELRVGSLRVFYEVAPAEPGVVHVLAVGKKIRNVLRVGGQEIKL
jgi:mRNA-degrading endonuclease RelE of RelBE toxin-antitoxin system